MSKQNFKSQAKRKRELAKLDKRTAKDQKRAAKKAENSVDVVARRLLVLFSPWRRRSQQHFRACAPRPSCRRRCR